MSTRHHDVPEPSAGDWSRRNALRAVGLTGAAAAGAAGLAACGGGGEGAGSGVGSAAPASGDTIKAADVPVGGGTVVESLQVVVTQPTDGDYKAFSAVCTHQGCLVSSVQDGTINCPCHGSRFDISTGDVVQGPATQPLPEKSVSVSGDAITVS